MTGARRTANARTAEDIRDRLLARLDARKKEIERLEEYYNGDHPLSFASPQFAQTFGKLFETFADNWCEIVVSAAAERLAVTGFRFKSTTAGDSQQADDAAWEIWQRNNLDAESSLAMTDAIKLGTSYAFVGEEGGKAVINIDHPADAITESQPMNPRKVTAGLRRWIDSDGTTFVVLALPDATYTWKRGTNINGGTWSLAQAVRNSLGVVPMVPLRNNPRTHRNKTGWRERIGVSDIAQIMGLQDAIDKTVVDMLVASEFAGFRQRWVTGIDIPKDPVTGESLAAAWTAGASRLWTAESDKTKFGEFDVTQLNNYVDAASMLLQHLSAQTRTPPHYLIGQIVNASGDALKAAETGLVAKVRSKQLVFGDDWEDIMRLAFRVEGDQERAADTSAETIWRDPETRSQAEVTDSVIKLKTIGVPLEILLEEYGYTPQQIQRVKEVITSDNLRALIDNLGTTNDQGDPTLPAVA